MGGMGRKRRQCSDGMVPAQRMDSCRDHVLLTSPRVHIQRLLRCRAGQKAREADDAEKYLKRSAQWQSLWNTRALSDGFKGFVVPRRSDGSWVEIDPKKNWGSWKEYFYEGSSWTSSYFIPHDFRRLVDLCGGKEQYGLRLEHALEHNLIDYSNEPSFLAIPSFNYADRPDRAAFWMHKLMRDGYP